MGPARPWERRSAENVPLPASATRVPQEVEGVTRDAEQHDSGTGPGLPVVVGRPVDHRRDAGAVVEPHGRPLNAPTWPGTPGTGTARATRATTGVSSSTWSAPATA